MKVGSVLLLYFGMALVGCGSSISVLQPVAAAPDLTGNWQIESTPASSSANAAGILLLGDLQSSGKNVSGTFRFSNLVQPLPCGLNQVVSLSGSIDAARNLTLSSQPLPNGTVIALQLILPSVLTDHGGGTIAVTGSTCSFATSAAIGVEFTSATGTFSGPLTPGTLLNPTAGTSGTGTLALNQSSVPTADGQFPVTGTISYAIGTCTGTILLAGDASGVGVTLTSTPSTQAGPTSLNAFSFLGTVIPTATQITATISIVPAPCSTNPLTSASYTGTLARQ